MSGNNLRIRLRDGHRCPEHTKRVRRIEISITGLCPYRRKGLKGLWFHKMVVVGVLRLCR